MLTKIDLANLEKVFKVARQTREQGNHPFGSLLAGPDGEPLLESGNATVTSRDCTAHAELSLVRLASEKYEIEFLEKCTIYCSTEPCAMCAGAIHWSGIGRVVYALSQDRLCQLTSKVPGDRPLRLSCREVFAHCARNIDVEGPVMLDEADAVHDDFWK